METHQLAVHPAFSPKAVRSVEARVGVVGPWLQARWRVEGSASIILPPFAGRQRRDGLWQATCFEMFHMVGDGPAYAEYNFSPSERWAAYRFDDVRAGMREAPADPAPDVTGAAGAHLYVLTAILPDTVLAGVSAAGLSAVIEEKDGTKSYWALAHGPGQPDFHAPACFALPLAAPERP